MSKKLTRVCVYGSLLSGLHNHGRLRNETYEMSLHNQQPVTIEFVRSEVVTVPFVMVSLGQFPALIPSEDTEIFFEVYDVCDTVLRSLDSLEGYNRENPDASMYKITEVTLEDGSIGNFYYMENRHTSKEVVPNGDWKTYICLVQSKRLQDNVDQILEAYEHVTTMQEEILSLSEIVSDHNNLITELKNTNEEN